MEQDTSISPNDEAPQANEGGVYVSLESLAEDGESPVVGDKVSVQVEGTIHSIDGGVACITPEMVNGEPAPEAPGEKPEPTSEDLRGALESAY